MELTFCRRKPHASPFEACFDDSLVGTFDAPRANRPACYLIGRVLHVRFALLQIGQFLLSGFAGVASDHPCQVLQHPLGSLVFEPMQHAVEPPGRQSASCSLHGLTDVADRASRMRKIENAHRIGTMVVDQARPPLRAILHRTDRCCPFQPSSMRFDQRCLRKALGPSRVAKRRKSAVCRPPLASCA